MNVELQEDQHDSASGHVGYDDGENLYVGLDQGALGVREGLHTLEEEEGGDNEYICYGWDLRLQREIRVL